MCDNITMRTGIFGGTFNPVHNEHVKIALGAVDGLKLDRLFVVPTFLSPHKSGVQVTGEDRLAMTKLAFAKYPKITVSDYEIKKGGVSYSYMTAEHFRKEFPDDALYLIVGEDMLSDFPTWKYPERIVASVDIAVFGRENFFGEKETESLFRERFGKNYERIPYTGKSVSSTEARIYSELSLPLSEIIPHGVEEYIKSNDLYKSNVYCEFVKKNLTQKRLIHTAEVTALGIDLAKKVGVSEEKTYIACILHDCAKYLDKKDFPQFTMPKDVPKPVEHAFLGAFVAENVFKVDDPEIIDAIRFHTSGKANMSAIGKIVFVADMLEKGRNYDGVEYLRSLLSGDFEKCFRECLSEEMKHLLSGGKEIYHKTAEACEFYLK